MVQMVCLVPLLSNTKTIFLADQEIRIPTQNCITGEGEGRDGGEEEGGKEREKQYTCLHICVLYMHTYMCIILYTVYLCSACDVCVCLGGCLLSVVTVAYTGADMLFVWTAFSRKLHCQQPNRLLYSLRTSCMSVCGALPGLDTLWHC